MLRRNWQAGSKADLAESAVNSSCAMMRGADVKESKGALNAIYVEMIGVHRQNDAAELGPPTQY